MLNQLITFVMMQATASSFQLMPDMNEPLALITDDA